MGCPKCGEINLDIQAPHPFKFIHKGTQQAQTPLSCVCLQLRKELGLRAAKDSGDRPRISEGGRMLNWPSMREGLLMDGNKLWSPVLVLLHMGVRVCCRKAQKHKLVQRMATMQLRSLDQSAPTYLGQCQALL